MSQGGPGEGTARPAGSGGLGTVLFVDDEPYVLSALRRAFGRSGFTLLVAGTGPQALELMAETPVDLVVADVRMAGMDGVRLLSEVRVRHPSVDRVILSGQVDRQTVLAAVTSGVARAFFGKPWDADALRQRITEILTTRKTLGQEGLIQLVGNVDSLPSLPPVYQEFVDLVARGRSLVEISAVIERDVGLAAKMMQVASSAFYGQRDVTTVARALSVLGLEATRDIALIVTLTTRPGWSADERRELTSVVLHSILVNRLSGEVYRLHHGAALAGVPSLGLLHDVGKLLLLHSQPERYRAIRARAARDGAGFHAAERALGFTESSHARLGGYLLDRWNLPHILVEAALYHVEPERAAEPHRPLIRALACADGVAQAVGDDGAWAFDVTSGGYLPQQETERLIVEAGKLAAAMEKTLDGR